MSAQQAADVRTCRGRESARGAVGGVCGVERPTRSATRSMLELLTSPGEKRHGSGPPVVPDGRGVVLSYSSPAPQEEAGHPGELTAWPHDDSAVRPAGCRGAR